MSGCFNQSIIIGNVCRDVEVRYSKENKPIANLSVATNETWKDSQGQKQEKSEFHRVTIFGSIAEVAQKYVKKGDKIMIKGKLQTRKWTDKDGNERYTTEIIVDMKGEMTMLGDVNKSQSQNNQEQQPAQPQNNQAESFDDDFPF